MYIFFAWTCCVSYTLRCHPLFQTTEAGSAMPGGSKSSQNSLWCRKHGQRSKLRRCLQRQAISPKRELSVSFHANHFSQLLWQLLHFSNENRKLLGLEAELCRAREMEMGPQVSTCQAAVQPCGQAVVLLLASPCCRGEVQADFAAPLITVSIVYRGAKTHKWNKTAREDGSSCLAPSLHWSCMSGRQMRPSGGFCWYVSS